MPNYPALAQTALRLITAAGKPVVLNKLSKTASDPAKPWRGPAAPTVAETQTEQAVELGINEVLTSFGAVLQKSDIPDTVTNMWMLARTDGNPDLANYDQLVCEGVTYRIDMLVRLRPAATTLLYIAGTSR